MSNVIEDLKARNCRINNEEGSVDAMLLNLAQLVMLVFGVPADEIVNWKQASYESYLHLLPSNGAFHEKAIVRYRILRWFGILRRLLSFNSWTELDLIAETFKPPRQNVTPTTHSTSRRSLGAPQNTQVRLMPLYRSVLDFVILRERFQDAEKEAWELVASLEDDTQRLETRVESLSIEYKEEKDAFEHDCIQEVLSRRHSEVNEAKARLEEVMRDTASASQNLKRMHDLHAQRKQQIEELDEKIHAVQDSLARLQDQIVESPGKLKQELRQVQMESDRAENELIATIEQTVLVKNLKLAIDNLESSCRPLSELIAIKEEYSKEAAEVKKKASELNAKQTALQQDLKRRAANLQEDLRKRDAEENELKAALAQLQKEEEQLKQRESAVATEQETSMQRLQQAKKETVIYQTKVSSLDQEKLELQRLCALVETSEKKARNATLKWDEYLECYVSELQRQSHERQNLMKSQIEDAIERIQGQPLDRLLV